VEAVPEVARLPLHAPEAVQDVAPAADHVRVDEPPDVTEVGLAESWTVGGGGLELPPSSRTRMALTKASPLTVMNSRLSVASEVTLNTRSTKVCAGTVTFERTRCPSALMLELRVAQGTQDSRNTRVTSTWPGVTGMSYLKVPPAE
jgi:hypothetical protein